MANRLCDAVGSSKWCRPPRGTMRCHDGPGRPFDRPCRIVDTSLAASVIERSPPDTTHGREAAARRRAMNSPLALHPALPTLDEDAWEDLLNFIEERRVIPIIGPELLQVDTDAGPRLLYEWVAERLAGKLGVDTAVLPKPYTLNDVVCWFLASRGRREEAYTRPVSYTHLTLPTKA